MNAGASNSSKTTIYKQLPLIWGEGTGYTPQEREDWKPAIFESLHSYWKLIWEEIQEDVAYHDMRWIIDDPAVLVGRHFANCSSNARNFLHLLTLSQREVDNFLAESALNGHPPERPPVYEVMGVLNHTWRNTKWHMAALNCKSEIFSGE